MNKRHTLLLTTIFLTSTIALGAESTLKQQMWQFALPDNRLPATIPNRIDRADTDENNNIIFNTPEAIYDVDVDYDSGYLALSFHGDILTRVIAYKDNNGYYTLFDDRSPQTLLCATKLHGKIIRSNRPLTDVLPEDLNFHTFAPQATKQNPLNYAPYYLDIQLPRHGLVATATLRPFLHPNYITGDQFIAVSDYETIGSPFALGRAAVAELLTNLHDPNTFGYLVNNQPQRISEPDRTMIEKTLNNIPYTEGEDVYVFNTESMIHELLSLKKIYELEQQIEYRSVKLGWDKDKARFFIQERIPNDTPPPPSLREYILEQLTDDDFC